MAVSTINLTRGMPPAEAFPVEDMVRCSELALRNDASVLLQYGRSPGYLPLRKWLAERHGIDPKQVLVANSSLEIFSFITQLYLRPGARAFVESPTYDRALTLLRRANADVVGIPLDEDGVNIAAVEAAIKQGPPTLFYVITDFQNPMGTTMSAAKRARLAELARQHNFWIIEDAPYRALRYWGEEAPTIFSLAPERVLHMSSFSKVLAPGLRLGYVIAQPDVIAALSEWAVDTYIGPVFPTQGAVYEYCRAGLLDPNIEALKRLYAPRLEATVAALEAHLPRATWTHPAGGFFVGVTLPPGADVATLVPNAAKVGLQLTDGRGFFPDPADGNRFLRIPFCSVKPPDMHEAIARLATLL